MSQYTEWLPQSETWWSVLVGSGLSIVLLEALLRPKISQMSLDVLEWSDLGNLKETARSVWTNLAVTSALLLTVAVAMLQSDLIEARFEKTEAMAETLNNVQSAYDIHCIFGMLYCMVSVLQCVVDLCYVDPLSNRDCIKFFIANPASIGGPVLSTIFGCLHTLIAMLMWVLGTCGLFHALVYAIFLLVVIVFLAWEIYDKGGFDPSGASPKSFEWQWPSEPKEKWPWFAKRASNSKAARIFQKMSAAIKDEEAKNEAM